MVTSQPVQSGDTPIQKIVIRPVISIPRSQSSPIPANQQRKAKNDSLAADEPNSLIRVINKLPNVKFTPESRTKNPHQLRFRVDLTNKFPIYFARAKVNGSFRNHPIRSYRTKLIENEIEPKTANADIEAGSI